MKIPMSFENHAHPNRKGVREVGGWTGLDPTKETGPSLGSISLLLIDISHLFDSFGCSTSLDTLRLSWGKH